MLSPFYFPLLPLQIPATYPPPLRLYAVPLRLLQDHSLMPHQLTPRLPLTSHPPTIASSPLKPLSPIKLFLLAFIRPIYAAERAHFPPYKTLIPLASILLAIALFLIFTISQHLQTYLAEATILSIIGFFHYSLTIHCMNLEGSYPDFLNAPIIRLLIPFSYYLLFSLILFPVFTILALIFAPRIAAPNQPLHAAWNLALKRILLLIPSTSIFHFTVID